MKSLKRINRRPLTILEILIVMAILSTTLTVIAVNVGAILREQRFHAGVDLLTDKLQLAQNIMILLDSDVELTIDTNRFGQYTLRLRSEKALTPALQSLVSATETLKGIDTIAQDDTTDMPLSLKFSALSHNLPRGVIKITAANGDLVKYITLKGYTSHITARVQPESIEENTNLSAQTYPKEIRDQWKPHAKK